MNVKLLPCPFCGGDAEMCTHDVTGINWMRCTKCGASNRASLSANEALAAWNVRTGQTCYNKWKIGFLCSECGVVVTGLNDINYCPNCGARVVC